jgi:hypothetical protein
VLQTTIRIIAFTKGPLDSLKIISHLAEPPETVLSALEAIPTGLNSITNLGLHAVSGSITDVRLPFPQPLCVHIRFRILINHMHLGHPFGVTPHPGPVFRPQIPHTLL